VWSTGRNSRREILMSESDLEFKLKAIEELEFEIIMATRAGNTALAAGLERALSILEEIT